MKETAVPEPHMPPMRYWRLPSMRPTMGYSSAVKPGVPLVTAETDRALQAVFKEIAEARGAPFHVVDPGRDVQALEVDVDPAGQRRLECRRAHGQARLNPGARLVVPVLLDGRDELSGKIGRAHV